MVFAEIIFLSFGLAFDAFAVSIVAGTRQDVHNPKARFRLSFHFGLFQLIMPIVGWIVGIQVANLFAEIDHWIAFAILSYIGIRMSREAIANEPETIKNNPSKGKNLILLSIATSIDALAVGFSLALLNIEVFFPAVCVGLITGFLSLIGIYLGKYFGNRFSRLAKIIGGVILIVIGVKIVVEHLYY